MIAFVNFSFSLITIFEEVVWWSTSILRTNYCCFIVFKLLFWIIVQITSSIKVFLYRISFFHQVIENYQNKNYLNRLIPRTIYSLGFTLCHDCCYFFIIIVAFDIMWNWDNCRKSSEFDMIKLIYIYIYIYSTMYLRSGKFW